MLLYVVIAVTLISAATPSIKVASKPMGLQACIAEVTRTRPWYEAQPDRLLGLGCVTPEAAQSMQSKFQ